MLFIVFLGLFLVVNIEFWVIVYLIVNIFKWINENDFILKIYVLLFNKILSL